MSHAAEILPSTRTDIKICIIRGLSCVSAVCVRIGRRGDKSKDTSLYKSDGSAAAIDLCRSF